VVKGVLTRKEVDAALSTGELTATTGNSGREELPAANREAVAFPVRLLRLANNSAYENGTMAFLSWRV
jgi:hypothetical protein